MSWLNDKEEYKVLKRMCKSAGAKLRKKHGIYILNFSQRESPIILNDLCKYTLQNTDLRRLRIQFEDVRKKRYEGRLCI